jgi:hypothetical protein
VSSGELKKVDWISNQEQALIAMFRPCLLIPVYNHGSLIEATFERLRHFNLPCIMVDDGSEPATASVLDRLAAQETSITLFRLQKTAAKVLLHCGV